MSAIADMSAMAEISAFAETPMRRLSAGVSRPGVAAVPAGVNMSTLFGPGVTA
jgi:hypothetical protein